MQKPWTPSPGCGQEAIALQGLEKVDAKQKAAGFSQQLFSVVLLC